jgi:hypothetical protein
MTTIQTTSKWEEAQIWVKWFLGLIC